MPTRTPAVKGCWDAAIRFVRTVRCTTSWLVVRVDAATVNDEAHAYLVEAHGAAFIVSSAASTHTGCEVSGIDFAMRQVCHEHEARGRLAPAERALAVRLR